MAIEGLKQSSNEKHDVTNDCYKLLHVYHSCSRDAESSISQANTWQQALAVYTNLTLDYKKCQHEKKENSNKLCACLNQEDPEHLIASYIDPLRAALVHPTLTELLKCVISFRKESTDRFVKKNNTNTLADFCERFTLFEKRKNRTLFNECEDAYESDSQEMATWHVFETCSSFTERHQDSSFNSFEDWLKCLSIKWPVVSFPSWCRPPARHRVLFWRFVRYAVQKELLSVRESDELDDDLDFDKLMDFLLEIEDRSRDRVTFWLSNDLVKSFHGWQEGSRRLQRCDFKKTNEQSM
jgi:hypothetical protein